MPEEGAEAAIPREALAVEALNEAPAQVIFGLRPCDARGLVQMDNVFGGYGGFYYDPLYNERRAATTVLAVTCRDPRSTCFCTAIGGCPAGHEGVDALFTQIKGGFTVEGFSEKGEAALAFTGLTEATEAQTAEAAEVKVQATTKVEVPFALDGVRDHLHDNIADPRWHDLCMRCISCGTCTYVCPSCYCFSINDEIVESSGERYRVWDNCFNPLYTEETSGHNPRAAKSNRFRNRFSHKFWYYPDKYDSLLCSGCGRCIMHCPTRIDIREVLRVMGEAKGAAGAAAKAAPAAECAPKGKGA
jgi:sulfhydrogenase subunit beta (sulfur reductase)